MKKQPALLKSKMGPNTFRRCTCLPLTWAFNSLNCFSKLSPFQDLLFEYILIGASCKNCLHCAILCSKQVLKSFFKLCNFRPLLILRLLSYRNLCHKQTLKVDPIISMLGSQPQVVYQRVQGLKKPFQEGSWKNYS